jgi:BolA family transcriptional regulator, general stress-responsive regulator
MSDDRVEKIRGCLTTAFQPQHLEIIDDSHQHAGHAGARSGGGHFTVHLVSAAFAGKSLVQRHRMVYEALSALMSSDIHALSIHAKTPDEMQ